MTQRTHQDSPTTGYARGTVQPGDLVTWHTSRGSTRGQVIEVLPDRFDGWNDFGPRVLIQCADPDCTSCKGGWEGVEYWKHYANECQLERATEDVEVALW